MGRTGLVAEDVMIPIVGNPPLVQVTASGQRPIPPQLQPVASVPLPPPPTAPQQSAATALTEGAAAVPAATTEAPDQASPQVAAAATDDPAAPTPPITAEI
jgi:hypothetical protein